MTWAPRYKVIDLSQIADNLLGYIETVQEDALEWAGGPGMIPFTKFYTNASGRLQTIFPSLMILAQRAETDLQSEALDAAVQMVLEGTVSGPNADELVASTKKYSMAVESMLANIPSETLMANSQQFHKAYITELETELDILRGNQKPSAFLQIFQIRVVYRLSTSGV